MRLNQIAVLDDRSAESLPHGDRVLRSLILNRPVTREHLRLIPASLREVARVLIWGDDVRISLPAAKPAPPEQEELESVDEPEPTPEEVPVETPPENRRRESRLSFQASCLVEIGAPGEAKRDFPGQVENITLHGLCLRIRQINRQILEQWKRTLENESPLKIAVRLDEPAFPTLSGQIVWIDPRLDEETAGYCLVGVFLDVLSGPQKEAMAELVKRAEGQPER